MNDFSVVKISAKGQITLPAKIRKNLKTRNLIVFENKNSIELQPLEIQKSTSLTDSGKITKCFFNFKKKKNATATEIENATTIDTGKDFLNSKELKYYLALKNEKR